MKNTPSILEKEVRISLRNSTIAGAVGVFFFMIVQAGPIPLMLENLGAGGIAIGLTAALFQLGLLIQIPAAFFTERLASRKLFWASTTIVARMAIAIPGIYLLLFPDGLPCWPSAFLASWPRPVLRRGLAGLPTWCPIRCVRAFGQNAKVL